MNSKRSILLFISLSLVLITIGYSNCSRQNPVGFGNPSSKTIGDTTQGHGTESGNPNMQKTFSGMASVLCQRIKQCDTSTVISTCLTDTENSAQMVSAFGYSTSTYPNYWALEQAESAGVLIIDPNQFQSCAGLVSVSSCANATTAPWLMIPSGTSCQQIATTPPASSPGPTIVNPTGLVLMHSNNHRDFTVGWNAGSGNGNCKLQYSIGGTWVDLTGIYNCDSNTQGAVGRLNDDGFSASTWDSATGIQVRLVRLSDNVALGTFGTRLFCSVIPASNTSTLLIDEDCNRVWDNSTSVPGSWYYGIWFDLFTGPSCANYIGYQNTSQAGGPYPSGSTCESARAARAVGDNICDQSNRKSYTDPACAQWQNYSFY